MRIRNGLMILVLVATYGLPRTLADDAATVAQNLQQTQTNMKMIMVAMHNYHDAMKSFPQPAILSKDKKPLLSWRVALLPFLDQTELYQKFRLDEPWDSAHNKKLIAEMPAVYRAPSSKVRDKGNTVYVVPRGESTAWAGPDGIKMRRMTDGTSNTIAVVEVDDEHAMPWTKPDDIKLDTSKPAAGLGGQIPGAINVAMFDGSVHSLPATVDADTLNKLFTPAGKEVVTIPEMVAGAAPAAPPTNAPGQEATRQMALNNVKQLLLAMHNHHDVYKSFPPPAILSKDKKPLLSWRVKLLPFLEQQDLYKQFHLDEPWDSQHNKTLIAKMPDVFRLPNSKAAAAGKTVYLVPRGDATAFPGPEGMKIQKITDGTSNTIAVVEGDEAHAVEWTRPDDWKFDVDKPMVGLGGHLPGHFVVGFCDGSSFLVENTFDPGTFKALITRAGREQIATPSE